MLYTLRIWKTEDAPTLTIDITARGGLSKCVVVDDVVGFHRIKGQ
jgi:hypothetical protein